MKKCPYCAEEIQDEAILCRYCGKDLTVQPPLKLTPEESARLLAGLATAPPPAQPAPGLPMPGAAPGKRSAAPLLFALILLVVMCAYIVAVSRKPGGSSGPTSADASIVCHDFVKRALKAPATADFPSYSQDAVSQSGSRYTVVSYVDSQNSFGAMIRTQYICTVEPSGGDNWRLVSLDTVP